MTPEQKRHIVESALSFIDKATEPRTMSKPDALTLIEQIMTELQCRADALKEEMSSDEPVLWHSPDYPEDKRFP